MDIYIALFIIILYGVKKTLKINKMNKNSALILSDTCAIKAQQDWSILDYVNNSSKFTYATSLILGISIPTLSHANVQYEFPVSEYQISGNQIFSQDYLETLVAPYTGELKQVADIQKAKQIIQEAYLSSGYGAVQVITPEQELSNGIVKIQIIESRIENIAFIGHKHFNEANLTSSLPALTIGKTPNIRILSENIQLANENPAKRIEVILSVAQDPEELEARVLVQDQKPLRMSVSVDNTGNSITGRTRLGAAIQHSNLFNRDHVATIAYSTSPEKLDQVDIYSLSYRMPLYAIGDSIDFIYGYSSVEAASSQTVAGPLNFSGSGRVAALRYNHHFARKGEYSSRLIFGIERRDYLNSCEIAGISCGSADEDVSIRPLSLSYAAIWNTGNKVLDFYTTISQNINGGKRGSDRDFAAVRQDADSNYSHLRAGASWVYGLNNDWQARTALTAQFTSEPLVPGEQIGLAGATSVRGFDERAAASDSGVVLNAELYTPNLSKLFGLNPNQSLRALTFYDFSSGNNRGIQNTTQAHHIDLASVGFGLRADWIGIGSLRLDVGRVVDSHKNIRQQTGDVRGHFSLNVLF